jgi:RNA polymerase sigma-70 factor, ECF subfamily
MDEDFDDLVQQYRVKVFRLVFSIVGNRARAEEVTQDVFLKIWIALPSYDGRASLSTWIYTIARNTSLSHRRSEAYRSTTPLDEVREPAAHRPGQFEDMPWLLEKLPDEQKEAVELFYLQERSIDDVAAMMDMPPGTVKSHLHRARRGLAKIMGVRL